MAPRTNERVLLVAADVDGVLHPVRVDSTGVLEVVGGGVTGSTQIQIIDGTVVSQKLAVDASGRITVLLDPTSLAALETVGLDAATLAALETIGLDAATLAALETISVANFPADYPDAAVLAVLVQIRDNADTVEAKLQTLIDATDTVETKLQSLIDLAPAVLTLSARMLAKQPATDYRLWFDTADASYIYIAEAPLAETAGTGTVFNGIRVPKDASGNPVGKTEELTAFAWNSRTSVGGWS